MDSWLEYIVMFVVAGIFSFAYDAMADMSLKKQIRLPLLIFVGLSNVAVMLWLFVMGVTIMNIDGLTGWLLVGFSVVFTAMVIVKSISLYCEIVGMEPPHWLNKKFSLFAGNRKKVAESCRKRGKY